MEANTVLLSLKEYNELRDFKYEIDKGHTYRIYYNGYSPFNYMSTKEEAVVDLIRINESLSAEISTLEKEDKVLNFKIKQMSFWQLFKYWIKGCKESSLF